VSHPKVHKAVAAPTPQKPRLLRRNSDVLATGRLFWLVKNPFVYSVLHCIMILRQGRHLLRLLDRAKPLFRMKKRSVDNVVIRGETRAKIGSQVVQCDTAMTRG
jgi:hypothetical protein